MPKTLIKAFDLNKSVKEPIQGLLEKNKILNCQYSDDEFLVDQFSEYKDQNTLVLCDIEGAENKFLDPLKAPSHMNMDMDIIVEAHDCFEKTTSARLTERFSDTHIIELIQDYGDRKLSKMPTWFSNMAHLDQLLAFWEWRSGPTPWLIMKSQSANLLHRS